MNGRARWGPALALLVSVAVVFAFAVTADVDASPPATPRGVSIPYEAFLADPLEGAPTTTLEETRGWVPYPVPMPSDAIASEDQVTGVWAGAGRVAISFAGGIVLIAEPPRFPDAEREFEGLLSSGSVDGRSTEVDGVPALVIEPGSDVTGTNPGAIQLVLDDLDPEALDGVSVTIYGEEVPGEDLVRIAETLTT